MINWTRKELKDRAKNGLRIYYGPAFAASLLSMFLAGGSGSAGSGRSIVMVSQMQPELEKMGMNPVEIATFLMAFFTTFLITFVITTVIQTFIGNIISVGSCRFYMESRVNQRSAGVSRLFWGFTCGHYMNEVKILFLMNVKIFLWSLLLIVPGIIKSYEYRMIPYILSENPGIDTKDAFALSKELMDGNKWAVFVLDLSFFGWAFLAAVLGMLLQSMVFFSILSMGLFAMLPTCMLAPYISATNAELYGRLRNL